MRYLLLILIFASCQNRDKYSSETKVEPIDKLNRFRVVTYIWQNKGTYKTDIMLSKFDEGKFDVSTGRKEGVTSFELDSIIKVHKQWAAQEVSHFRQLDSTIQTP